MTGDRIAETEDRQVIEWLREALDMDEEWAGIARGIVTLRRRLVAPTPDRRLCGCWHLGSVHDAAPGAPLTDLGWPVTAVGKCHGTQAGGGKCPCLTFAEKQP